MGQIYDVNIKRLVQLALPTRWRKSGFGTFLYALTAPLGGMLIELRGFRKEQELSLQYTGQVCRLRKLIRDTVGGAELSTAITVEDYDSVGEIAAQKITLRNRGQWLLVGYRGTEKAVILKQRGYSRTKGYDFWVNIPKELKGKIDEQYLKARIDNYKLVSKKYVINYI